MKGGVLKNLCAHFKTTKSSNIWSATTDPWKIFLTLRSSSFKSSRQRITKLSSKSRLSLHYFTAQELKEVSCNSSFKLTPLSLFNVTHNLLLYYKDWRHKLNLVIKSRFPFKYSGLQIGQFPQDAAKIRLCLSP